MRFVLDVDNGFVVMVMVMVMVMLQCLYPRHMLGLVCIGGVARQYTWPSWIANQAERLTSAFNVWSSQTHQQQYFLKRWFSEVHDTHTHTHIHTHKRTLRQHTLLVCREQASRSSNPDLIDHFRQSFHRLNWNNVSKFVEAFEKRKDITSNLSKLRYYHHHSRHRLHSSTPSPSPSPSPSRLTGVNYSWLWAPSPPRSMKRCTSNHISGVTFANGLR